MRSSNSSKQIGNQWREIRDCYHIQLENQWLGFPVHISSNPISLAQWKDLEDVVVVDRVADVFILYQPWPHPLKHLLRMLHRMMQLLMYFRSSKLIRKRLLDCLQLKRSRLSFTTTCVEFFPPFPKSIAVSATFIPKSFGYEFLYNSLFYIHVSLSYLSY
ncbi:hypothetical protein LXL04_012404 [Taraxacum kok-saghyz]